MLESNIRSARPNRVSWRTFVGLRSREPGEGEGQGGGEAEKIIAATGHHRSILNKRARGRSRQLGAGATEGAGSSAHRGRFRARGGMQDDAWQAGGWGEENSRSSGGSSGGGAFGGLRDPVQALSGARPSSAESDSLPADLRDRALSAVEALVAEPGRAAGGNQGGGSGRERYGRVTVGDVAARSGLKVGDTEKALKAFAADGEGFLEVSDEGDVLYVLPRNLRALIAQRSLRMRLAPMAAQAKAAAGYVMRVSFGTALVASVVVVYTSIFVLMTSAQADSDERRGRWRVHYHRYRGPTFFFNIADLLWYWDPGYHRRVRSELQQREMSFLESVFSFVFGDGDPNDGREQHRWTLIGEVISSRGGVVAAQEIAPYLDLPEDLSNEAYMLPVLQRFQGTPSVDDQGHILYAFPMLQRTAEQHATRTPSYSNSRAPAPIFVENTWSFSDAPPTKRALAVGLGIVNVVGVLILSTMLRNPAIIRKAGLPLVSTIQRLIPALQAYSVAFFVIPLCRWAFLSSTNSAIETRNQRRRESAHILSHPSPHIRKKGSLPKPLVSPSNPTLLSHPLGSRRPIMAASLASSFASSVRLAPASSFLSGERIQQSSAVSGSTPAAVSASPVVRVVAVRKIQGTVVSTANDKTAAVEVKRIYPHKLYKKRIASVKRYQAHDPENQCRVGDFVTLAKATVVGPSASSVGGRRPGVNVR
ncbi:unnamed protein product [Closterium sp. Naga37s-1]|nr:unnamed protein product [Closterium sp. Naga37s-1]